MIFTNSIRNLLRARGKTTLFFALLFLLTLLVGLDGYVWYSVTGYLDACDENYTTVAQFEYMGADYPDERVFDRGAPKAAEGLRQLQIADRSGVRLWDASARAWGYADGFTRTDRDVYNKNRAVLVIRSAFVQGSGLYWCYIMEAPYSFHECTGIILHVDANGLATLEDNHFYLVSGEYYDGPSSYKYFRLMPHEHAGVACPVFLDVTDPDAEKGYTVPGDSVFLDIAATENILNNCLDVHATADLNTQLPFHQDQVVITAGRAFTPEEYASRAKACIVSETLSTKLGLGAGDALPLSLIRAEGGTAYDSFWAGDGFASSADYRIAGVMRTPETMTHLVYVPAGADPAFDQDIIGYTLGTALLENGMADDFYSQMQPLLPDRVRLTIYDQGYAAAEKPFREILRVTNIVTVVCALAGLSIIVLFGYLFVYRQRDVSVIMIRLGAGKRRVLAYFLFGSGMLALVSAGLGAVLGYLLSGGLGTLITRIAGSVSPTDLRYSNAAQSVTRTLAFSPTASPALFCLAALAIFLLAALCCLLFTVGALGQRRARTRRSRRNRKAGARFSPRGGRTKYTLLSIARGGARSIVTPVTAMLAAVLLCQLIASGASYRADRDALFSDTVIQGSVTDNHGKATGRLTVPGPTANALLRSGFLDNATLSRSYAYVFEGILSSGGVEQAFTPLDIPTGEYSFETFLDRVRAGPSLIYTNSLEKAPEFYYSSSVLTEYLDGYDGSVFASTEEMGWPIPCLVSTNMMAEKGIRPGDVISVLGFTTYTNMFGSTETLVNTQLLVVGSYVKAGVKDNIYCPLAAYIEPELLWAEEDDPAHEELTTYTFRNLDFTLTSASRLEAFKDWLWKGGYSDVAHSNRTRVYLRLDDRSLNDTAETLSRQIRYTDVLYPVLMALTGAAGLVAAYLLVLNRKREYAIMRVLGAPPRRVFGTLFLEQVLLCIPGAALGLAAAVPVRIFSGTGALLTAGFVFCWLAGSAAALVRMNSRAVLATIHEEE